MRATEAFKFSNISATTAAFDVDGGRYQLNGSATWGGGSIDVQQLGPDGSTWVTVAPVSGSHLTADGSLKYELPPGQTRILVATATAVYAVLVRVPLE